MNNDESLGRDAGMQLSVRRSEAADPIEIVDYLKSELEKLKAQLQHQQLNDQTSPSAGAIRRLLHARRQREAVFGGDLFADPAWDMLLELYAAELNHERLSTTLLCDASAVPLTTALRWISKLSTAGLVTKEMDPADGRKVLVRLSKDGLGLLDRYFSTVLPQAGL